MLVVESSLTVFESSLGPYARFPNVSMPVHVFSRHVNTHALFLYLLHSRFRLRLLTANLHTVFIPGCLSEVYMLEMKPGGTAVFVLSELRFFPKF